MKDSFISPLSPYLYAVDALFDVRGGVFDIRGKRLFLLVVQFLLTLKAVKVLPYLVSHLVTAGVKGNAPIP